MNIRPIQRTDYNQWLPLWQLNCQNKISDNITQETWRRLCNPKEAVYGLGVFDDQQQLYGFVHYILHPVTGFVEPACYMQDLYIREDTRRQGLAKRLVWELHDIGQQENWARLYWFADNKDPAVQALYQSLGVEMDFGLFILQTHQ